MSASFAEYPIYLWQLLNGFRSRHEAMFARLRDRDISDFSENSTMQILDLGNGRLRPQYLLLKGRGHRVCGIDIANRAEISATNVLYALARWLYCWRSGVSDKAFVNETLVCGNVDNLPFRPNAFDLVTSVAALEHFLDVPAIYKGTCSGCTTKGTCLGLYSSIYISVRWT